MESSKLKETYEKQKYQSQANLVYVNTIIIGAILVFIYFFILKTYSIAVANIVLLAVSYISIRLNRKEQYALSSLIFITTVAFTAFLQIHEFGLRTGFQYFYLNLSGLVMFTNWKPWQKAAGTMLLVSSFVLSFQLNYQATPPVELSYFWVFFLHTVNILLNVAGVANSAHYYITITKKAHQTLTDLAMKDYLTGLMNRTSFDHFLLELCEGRVKKGHGMSILLLDLDHFKRINDTYGHLCGDELLRQIGIILQEQTRKEDCAARYGGEEFVIVSKSDSIEETALFAESIRKRVHDMQFTYKDQMISVTLSIGALFISPQAATHRQQALELADQLLYRAKSGGRNKVVSEQLAS